MPCLLNNTFGSNYSSPYLHLCVLLAWFHSTNKRVCIDAERSHYDAHDATQRWMSVVLWTSLKYQKPPTYKRNCHRRHKNYVMSGGNKQTHWWWNPSWWEKWGDWGRCRSHLWGYVLGRMYKVLGQCLGCEQADVKGGIGRNRKEGAGG